VDEQSIDMDSQKYGANKRQLEQVLPDWMANLEDKVIKVGDKHPLIYPFE